MKLWSQSVGFAGLLFVASACGNLEGPTAANLATSGSDDGISCRVTVGSGEMNCNTPPGSSASSVALNVVVGGPQNAYVTLASNTPAYNGPAHTFTVNVTVQNRSAQIMGTADGTTGHAEGIRVFFFNQPTAVTGTGTITVTGDGSGTFTHAGQPYYQYPGPLAPGATAAQKAWTFDVPNTVTTFSFYVGVSTKVPDDAGVLRWSATTVGTHPLDEISEACGTLWAVGGTAGAPSTGVIQYYNGTTWAAQTNPVPTQVLHSVEMHCATGTATGVAVGENGTVLYYNGTSWANVSPGGGATLMSVSRAGTEWFACGLGGVILHSTTGSGGWAAQTSNTSTDLFACGGPAATNVYAAGATGLLTHYNGATWDPTGYTSGFTNTTTIRTATASGSEIWLLGDNGTITHTTNGTAFTAQTSGSISNLYGAEGFGSTVDLYAVGGGGTILNYNGTVWTAQASTLGGTDVINDVAIRTSGGGATFLDAWAVGNGAVVLHGTR